VALGFGTEGGLFAAALDIPVVICGPGDIAVAHRPDEFVDAAQLMSCLAFLRRVIDDVCIRR
jgi:acetylornithine deacetylase